MLICMFLFFFFLNRILIGQIKDVNCLHKKKTFINEQLEFWDFD